MEITKPNDILVTTINNPQLTPYDMLSNNIKGENTSLFSKDEYKKSKYIQKVFKDEKGDFDEDSFNKAYKLAEYNFFQLTNDEYLKSLDEIEYSPFDSLRPKFAKTFNVSATFEKEYNPFEVRRGWTGLNSEDEGNLSLKELAQKGKIYDPSTDTWSNTSINDLSLMDKFLGDTYVYATYDEDGQHLDPNSGLMIAHKAGDWKISEDGSLFVEKLAGREVYGKQVVNPMDALTTDGSIINKFDFLDSDGREKSIAGTAFKLGVEIAPFLIPEIGIFKGATAIPAMYGSLKAIIGLTSVMPTFYKSFEGLLMGDKKTALTQTATELEGWMAKINAPSISDEGSASLFSVERMADIVGSIFSQIYEQRAAASLSKIIFNSDKVMTAETEKMAIKINQKLIQDWAGGKISADDIPILAETAMQKIPELKSMIAKQSQMSKALSLGYMALTSTGEIYGEAIKGGYDRRTAGFAALAAAAGQYGIMMNNQLGTWFLDKSTGYSENVNKALISKSVTPWLDEIATGFKAVTRNTTEGKKQLGTTFGKIANSIKTTLTTPSVLGEAMWKNSIIEGVEEVTEQVVLDATKGIVDVLSYLGYTKKQGSFGGWDNVFSKAGLENYLANFVGGLIGGGMFEFHRSKIAPWLDPSLLNKDTQKSVYELVAGGQKEALIDQINSKRSSYGNRYISPLNMDGSYQEAKEGTISQADLIANKAIEMVNVIDGIFNNHKLVRTDDEIIDKAMRDKIVIDMLKKTAPKDSSIGIEGLILEDYKNKMSKIGELESLIKNLPDSKDNAELLKSYKEELKLNIESINDIIEGKYGSEYFGRAIFYLSKDIHAPFINLSKTGYTEATYGKKYHELPEKGLGFTKERMDKEWEEYVNSTDILKNLETAYNVYKEVEKFLNPALFQYSESGYDVVRKETLENVLDLKNTIELFNTAKDPKEKEKIFERFVRINEKFKEHGVLVPWDSFHNDIADQLFNLGLIKKTTFKTDAEGNYLIDEKGNLILEVSDFTEVELNSLFDKTSKKDEIKTMVQGHFKNFPMNPLDADLVTTDLNKAVNNYNIEILKQIKILEKKETLTPEEEAKLTELKNSLQNFTINSFDETEAVLKIKRKASLEFKNLLSDVGITEDQFTKYLLLKERNQTAQKDSKTIIGEIQENISSWENLDRESLVKFIDELKKLGLFTQVLNELTQKTSSNIAEIINENVVKLQDLNLSPEDFVQIQEKLKEFLDIVVQTMDTNFEFLTNKEYQTLEEEQKKITTEVDKKTALTKPNILKIHNFALEVLTKALKEGNADKEVFIIAENLMKEEVLNVVSNIFPENKNLNYEQLLVTVENIPKFIERLLTENTKNYDIPGEITLDSSLEDLFNEDQEQAKLDPNYKNIIPDNTFLEVLKNNFDKNLELASIRTSLEKALVTFEEQKDSIKRIDSFLEVVSKGLTLKSNPLYDLLRKFELSLDSNPNNKVNKIFEILKQEELKLKEAANITNYSADNIRTSDLNQAINHLKVVKSVILAMSTTTVDLKDPIGFIQSRIAYAEKYAPEEEVTKLKTITSDVASLMVKDVDILITKLQFLKDFSTFNTGKLINEDKLVKKQVENILLQEWEKGLSKINPSFLPLEKLKEILASTESDSVKLMKIENAVFDHNKNNKQNALIEFLNQLEHVDSDQFSQMDKEISSLESWDLAVYYSTVLALRSEDFYIKSLSTVKSEFNKIPFFTQEFATRIIEAHTMNPMLFMEIYNKFPNKLKTSSEFITVVLGGSGTGKTSAIFGSAIDHFRQTNDLTEMWLAAPENLQKKNLEEAIENSAGKSKLTWSSNNKSELFEKLGITDIISDLTQQIENVSNTKEFKESNYVKLEDDYIVLTDNILNEEWIKSIPEEKLKALPNLLLIDEITHFSSFELHILNAISRYSYNNKNLKFMKIIGAGDPTQMGYLAKVNNKFYNYNIQSTNAIFTPRLWTSIRSLNAQKRANLEKYTRITRDVENIYNENNKNENKAAEAELKALTYLKKNEDVNTLSFYEDSKTINGDKVVKVLDKVIAGKLNLIVKENPNVTIGILTENGELSEEMNAVLSDAGLITPTNMGNIKLFNPKNIQGSEVDYFIFDAKFIKEYDKVREQLKAFYTFMSRSKIASIIIDETNILGEYRIENGKKDDYPSQFEMITNEMITTTKKNKEEELVTMLGASPILSESGNFKWDTDEDSQEEIIKGSWYVQNISAEDSNTGKTATEEQEGEEIILKKDFKVMFHSFYNNPGAIVNENGITVNSDLPNTDLNFSQDVESSEKEAVIKGWLNLKNFIIHNKDAKNINSSDAEYHDYLKHVFKGDMDSAEKIAFEIVTTASFYGKDINTPFAKQGLKEEATLNEGDLFVNLSAKITFGQKTHYITLATLGTQEKILAQAQKYEGVTEEQINKRFSQIKDALIASKKSIISFNIKDKNSFDFYTKTRIVPIKVVKDGKETNKNRKFYLNKLEEEFPGINHSNIKFFPKSFEDFKELMKTYTFGTERFTGKGVSEEEVEKKLRRLFEGWTETITEKGKTKTIKHPGLKNKPYIAFSTNNDLEGNINSTNTHATLIPISASKRDLKTLTGEVEQILDERREEIAKIAKQGGKNFFGEGNLNTKTETLLNRYDILKVLIEWGKTKLDGNKSLLDSLLEEIQFSVSDTITGNKTSVLDIFSRFKNNPEADSESNSAKIAARMRQVIKIVQDTLAKNNNQVSKKVEQDIINQLAGISSWHWTFFNIFAYNKIIDEAKDAEFMDLIIKGQVDNAVVDAFNKSAGATKMKEILANLLKPLGRMDFYYSIPITKANKGVYQAHSLISGEQGFSEETLADKFYINAAPEGGRLLMDIETFLDSNLETNTQSKPEVKVEPEVESETEINKDKDEDVEDVEQISLENKDPFGNSETSIIKLEDVKDVEDLVIYSVSNFFDEEIKMQLFSFLSDISKIHPDTIFEKLSSYVNTDTAQDPSSKREDDQLKIRSVLSKLGFVLNKGDRSINRTNTILVLTSLGETNEEVSKNIRKKINELLKTCNK